MLASVLLLALTLTILVDAIPVALYEVYGFRLAHCM